ncbi:UDP-glucose/GDP-mannose dehydrogenase family protein [Gammaproteobacteria bacterium]|jgi:UDPglucose 6-dehydrogenase|nr:UDP-glucose/GDP-mannose dehydrogenase family protein [Gammaproteobacteria bacterium]MDC0129012.1 UDP-glucose/GDP-mannose dehydrogenase family protein [Gammaproteobacteria bacterium]
MKITIIGSGYVGLVTGACLAEAGHMVSCLDVSDEKILSLKKSIIPFHEPKLEDITRKAQKNKRLFFTTSYAEGLDKTEAIFLCVGTPSNHQGDPNLKYLKQALQDINNNLNTSKKIALFIKSTVPVGTNKFSSTYYKEISGNQNNLIFASNPEFLKEGHAVDDFKKPDRIIIGTESAYIKKISRSIYKKFLDKNKILKFTRIESAELIKYASNAFLATKISFINEISQLCDKVDADIEEVKVGMGLDNRIGSKFLNAGIGFGGSCFPKDLDGLIYNYKNAGLNAHIPHGTKAANSAQLNYFYKKIAKNLNLKGSNILFWGLAFKPDTDDIRESVSIKLIKKLSKHVNKIYAYDPVATKNAKNELSAFNNINFLRSPYQDIKNCDVLVLATEWGEFINPDYTKLKKLKQKIIFDGRNVLNIEKIESNDLKYFGVGRN